MSLIVDIRKVIDLIHFFRRDIIKKKGIRAKMH